MIGPMTKMLVGLRVNIPSNISLINTHLIVVQYNMKIMCTIVGEISGLCTVLSF